MEHNRNKQPHTVNVSWKANQENIINLAFGASVTATDWKDRESGKRTTDTFF
ncbi:hypothetical protein RhiirA5_366410 [Rhizophagus irregularis]|uniref:Uncharacterized protein n=1 Tax=Rhizophagus irregularis TaxID=588596 RepID=A0A2I1FCE0_9GLOM|nr:hypothetical protein RhiirA5_366410 [Rhizophagus irregularis]PKC58491.1 hypothetical protein RhiirA1_427654 [Rhizophagus irregularis]PKY32065.1 hypothetical protein RhiirB3_419900 [Rhizophagus irregularis]